MSTPKPKSFWSKPEGVTGILFIILAVLGIGFVATSAIGALAAFVSTGLGIGVTLAVLGTIIFMALDGKTRTLVSYLYKSTMRWITGIFVKIDPIGILKSYVDDLRSNLKKMNKQMNQLRGQMHKLREMIFNNQKEIASNITLAGKARDSNQKNVMILKSRKAGRLKDSNLKLEDLYKKMEIMYRVLKKMYENSSILLEDIDDQVKLKEQEYKAMMAGHSAMRSAMNVIKGDPDKKALFDSALEAIADDVSNKVGEMEQFMELSENFMQSVDLQNGIFEEQGLKMLEEWEAKSDSLLLGSAKEELILESEGNSDFLDLESPMKVPADNRANQYDSFFE